METQKERSMATDCGKNEFFGKSFNLAISLKNFYAELSTVYVECVDILKWKAFKHQTTKEEKRFLFDHPNDYFMLVNLALGSQTCADDEKEFACMVDAKYDASQKRKLSYLNSREKKLISQFENTPSCPDAQEADEEGDTEAPVEVAHTAKRLKRSEMSKDEKYEDMRKRYLNRLYVACGKCRDDSYQVMNELMVQMENSVGEAMWEP